MSVPALRHARLRRLLAKPLGTAERVFGGGRARERVLLGLLSAHYASRFRREWMWTADPPHFFDHRLDAFDLAFGSPAGGIYPWFRGFYVAEIVRENDVLLDIGCGDGFFTSRFYAIRCRAVDGLDIEPSAVAAARTYNAAPNVRYHLCDAVADSFPRKNYNVIVWDGALGHFSSGQSQAVLAKAASALTPDGIFCGSESLGYDGSDHLQFFADLESLHETLSQHFPCVWLRELTYSVRGRLRREAFWRCAKEPTRQEASCWHGPSS